MKTASKEPSFDTKQKILRLVVDRILVEDDRLVIKHIVPAVPFRLRPGSPVSISPLPDLAREAGEAEPFGAADPVHRHCSW